MAKINEVLVGAKFEYNIGTTLDPIWETTTLDPIWETTTLDPIWETTSNNKQTSKTQAKWLNKQNAKQPE